MNPEFSRTFKQIRLFLVENKIVKMQFVVLELVVGSSEQQLYKMKESSRLH